MYVSFQAYAVQKQSRLATFSYPVFSHNLLYSLVVHNQFAAANSNKAMMDNVEETDGSFVIPGW